MTKADNEQTVRPFILVGMPRTGSSLVLSGIGQHPAVIAHGELLHRMRSERAGSHAIRRGNANIFFDEETDDAIAFLKREVFGATSPGIQAVGFKLHGEFVAAPSTQPLLRRLKDEVPELAIVHVVRRDYMDVLISRRVAEASGQWYLHKGNQTAVRQTPRLRIEPAEAFRFFDSMEQADCTFESVFGGGAYLQVGYESVSRDFTGEMSRIYEFLGLARYQAEPRLEKQVTAERKDIVENLDELSRFFASTPYAAFFRSNRRRICFIKDKTMRIEDYSFDLDWSGSVRTKFSIGRDFILMKSPKLIEEYERVLDGLAPGTVFELGIRRGGSMVMFNLAFRPKAHVAIEIETDEIPALTDVVRIAVAEGRTMQPLFGVNQGDRARLLEIVREYAAPDPRDALDLVIDDASHVLELSRASFETLFPCLRPGGLYALEDWGWAHWRDFQGNGAYFNAEAALTNLVFELIILHACRPDIIKEIRVTPAVVFVERGPAVLDVDRFRIGEHLVMRNRVWTPI